MDFIDLHVHTTASDGTFSPSEIVDYALEKNLSVIAITDHDTVAAVSKAQSYASDKPIEIIPGIEFSCSYMEREVHILGYYIDCNNEELLRQLELFRDTRDNRNILMVEKFAEYNIPISLDEMGEMFPNAVITRAHFASYLVKKGYVKNIKEAFDRYVGDYAPCFITRRKIPVDKAIELIHSVGGVAVLAHPMRYKMGKEEIKKLVSTVTAYGIDGIEAIYSTYSLSDENVVRQLAKENHLLITGGSDFHGKNKTNIDLGDGTTGHSKIPADLLPALIERHLIYRP